MSTNEECWICGKPNVNQIGSMRLCADHSHLEPISAADLKIKSLEAEVERLRGTLEHTRVQLGAERAKLEAENTRLKAELKAEQKDRREPGCQCTWEVGDSLCPVHPLNPATELPYTAREAADLEAENTELRGLYDASAQQVGQFQDALKTANASTVKAQDEAARQYAAFVNMRNRRDLELANAEHAKASEQEAWAKAEALKKQLAWFEEYYSRTQRVFEASVIRTPETAELGAWLAVTAKPSEGT